MHFKCINERFLLCTLFPKWVACLGASNREETMNLNEKKPNKWWTEPDTFAMLALIEQMGLVHELDKKRQRNESLFRRLRLSLAKRGINFTVTQIRNRWKSLKHKYRKIKLASYRSPAARLSAIESFRYFHMLDHMLVRRPKAGSREDDLTDGHALLGRSLADLDDHTDSTDALCLFACLVVYLSVCKGMVHPKMKILFFTHPHVIPDSCVL